MLNVIAEKPLVGSKETFEWLTDIIESRDGREHRIMLRSLPRVTLDYSFIAHPHNRSRYINLLHNNSTDIWFIPDWFRAVYIGPINKNTFLFENYFNNHEGDNLLIYQDSSKNEVATWLKSSKIESLEFVFDNQKHQEMEFIFKDPTDEKKQGLYLVNDYLIAYLLPLQECCLKNVTYKTPNFDTQFDVTIELIESPIYRAKSIETETYLGIEVLHNNYSVNESSFNKNIDIVDYELGKITRMERWDRTKSSGIIKFYLDGLDEITKFKEFIYRIGGRLTPFWLCDDVNVCDDNIRGNQITIKSIYYSDLPSFKYLALFHDNSVVYVKIMDVKQDEYDNTVLIIDKTIKKPVKKISHLMLCRFDSDSVQIKYNTNQQAESNIQVVEVFDDQYF